MLVRAIIAGILAGALAIGALYGIDRFLGRDIAATAPPEPIAFDDPAEDPAEDEADAADMGDEAPAEPQDEQAAGGGEPPLPLPYEDGEAAQWLASALEGSGPVPAMDAMTGDQLGDIDLADRAGLAAEPQPEAPAEPQAGDTLEVHTAACQPSHVLLSCSISTAFTEWEPSGEGEPVSYESAETIRFNMVQTDGEPWAVDEESVEVFYAG